MLREIAAEREIVGCDVNELAPIPGLHHANFTAAKLTQRLMGLMQP
jgi:agmatinase